MIYQINGTSRRFKNMEDARKAILDRKFAPLRVEEDLVVMGEVYNEHGMKMGQVLWNIDVIPDMPEYLFEDSELHHVWPLNEDGSIVKDPYRVECCHPDCAKYFLSYVGGPGFKTLQDAIRGF